MSTPNFNNSVGSPFSNNTGEMRIGTLNLYYNPRSGRTRFSMGGNVPTSAPSTRDYPFPQVPSALSPQPAPSVTSSDDQSVDESPSQYSYNAARGRWEKSTVAPLHIRNRVSLTTVPEIGPEGTRQSSFNNAPLAPVPETEPEQLSQGPSIRASQWRPGDRINLTPDFTNKSTFQASKEKVHDLAATQWKNVRKIVKDLNEKVEAYKRDHSMNLQTKYKKVIGMIESGTKGAEGHMYHGMQTMVKKMEKKMIAKHEASPDHCFVFNCKYCP